MNTVIHGRWARLLFQIEDAFRTAPGTPAAYRLPFHETDFGREPDRQEDPTLQGEALTPKRDEDDSMLAGPLTSRLDLNAIGWWLYLLWGAPVTTGTGPYEHVFTLDLDERPSALIEIAYQSARFQRYLGVVLNSISWNVIEAQQNMTLNLMGAAEVLPRPVATFDAAYSELAKSRACSKGGEVYDVDGASTLGHIAGASVEITNDLEGQRLADNQEGPGFYLLGQPAISGTLRALFENDKLADKAIDHDDVPLSLISRNGADMLELKIPEAEFDAPKSTIGTSRGIVHEIPYRAFMSPGGTAPTITLTNQVASYAP